MRAERNFSTDRVSDLDVLFKTQWDDREPDKPRQNSVQRLLQRARAVLVPPEYYVEPPAEPADPNREASEIEYAHAISKVLGEMDVQPKAAPPDNLSQAS